MFQQAVQCIDTARVINHTYKIDTEVAVELNK